MITLTRRQIRRLRTVVRRNLLGVPARGPAPTLVLRTERGQLRAHLRHGSLAVEHVEPIAPTTDEIIAVPLDALAECAGRDESTVAIEASRPGRTTIRWTDRGIPQVRESAVATTSERDEVPRLPERWGNLPATFLDALAEAAQIVGNPGRYALDCVRLDGPNGRVIATDGHQLLIQSGFGIPWDDAVLIDGSPVFGATGLPRDRALQLGRTATHVVIRAGAWTLWCAIRTGLRYPNVDAIVPTDSHGATMLQIESADAVTLTRSLDRLPGADQEHRPVTLECNGCVAVRARPAESGPVTELVLERSAYSGSPTRVCTDRRLLARAVRLGCASIAIETPNRPLVGRHDRLIYVWQPLEPAAAIAHGDDAIPIVASATHRSEVPPARPVPRRPVTTSPEPNPVLSTRSTPMREPRSTTDRTVRFEPTPTIPTDSASLIAEAERLHATLNEAKLGLARLIAGLRRSRKQSKQIAETLRSLRQLRLAESVD
jgi:hypothetical protein